jgi:hypothetical protein
MRAPNSVAKRSIASAHRTARTRGVAHVLERDEEDTGRKRMRNARSDRDGKTGLAGTCRAGERDETWAVAGENVGDLRKLALAAAERRRGNWKVYRPRFCARVRRLERRVLLEDLPLEAAQPFARLEAELVEGGVGVSIGGERLGLAAGAVEGEHQLAA